MSSQDNDQDNRVVAVVLISTILLAVGLALGMGIYKARQGSGKGMAAASSSAAAMATGGEEHSGEGHGEAHGDAAASNGGAESGSATASGGADSGEQAGSGAGSEAAGSAASGAALPAVSADEASIVMENGVVKFYFASGKADLAPGALAALGDAIAAAKGGKRLVLSGFHDATGSAALNAELAKKRAMAVHDALLGAGVPESSMELKKPEETTGTGSAAEARRVEVTIAE
jgi:outer membrane protein OmpA-like peptidoglycan-associated protein